MDLRLHWKKACELGPWVAAALALAPVCAPVGASECGNSTPDYTANRTLSVGAEAGQGLQTLFAMP